MSKSQHPIFDLLEQDPRFKLEAYQFVRDALSYAQEVLEMGGSGPEAAGEADEASCSTRPENHLTGQQLCEAIRQYAIDQFGYMAKAVLNSWGVRKTSDFGDIVYNLIDIGYMKKSKTDRREDFDNVYDFDEAFLAQFRITLPD
ncbi:MAG: hypothetical protein J5I93_08220 [Pirellulaceae bacterium]|nr:hypothetical protein [Pirellulaceae bacterium]